MRSSRKVIEEYSQYLNDESGLVTTGEAEEIFLPEVEADIINLVNRAE